MQTSEILPDTSHIQKYVDQFISILVDYAPRLVSAFLILLAGLYAIKLVNSFAQKMMVKKQFEPTLTKFLTDIMIWALRILLFVTFIGKLGIETTAFAAILGAAGLAIGLSLQGSLSNFAGGMLIVLFKPFRVHDTIEAQGVIGTVTEIQIFVTKLVTGNNHTIFIPNGTLSNGVITNFSAQGTRRAELIFSVSYTTDLSVAKGIIMDVLKTNPKVLQTPAPSVAVIELTDSAVKLAIRPWTKIDDFGTVTSEVLESCKIELYKAGIDIQPSIKQSNV